MTHQIRRGFIRASLKEASWRLGVPLGLSALPPPSLTSLLDLLPLTTPVTGVCTGVGVYLGLPASPSSSGVSLALASGLTLGLAEGGLASMLTRLEWKKALLHPPSRRDLLRGTEETAGKAGARLGLRVALQAQAALGPFLALLWLGGGHFLQWASLWRLFRGQDDFHKYQREWLTTEREDTLEADVARAEALLARQRGAPFTPAGALHLRLAEMELTEAQQRLEKWRRYHGYSWGSHSGPTHALKYLPSLGNMALTLSLGALALLPLALPLGRELGVRYARRFAAQVAGR